MALSVENQRPARTAPAIVVMGVSGVGKTTVAKALAERLGLPYGEADDFHPAANIAKMAAGHPLDDKDREPWLKAIGGWLAERVETGTGGVITCSALKRGYRDLLREACPEAFFLHLTGSTALVEERLAHRSGHFMKARMLDSQLAILEPLAADENGAVLDIGPSPETLVESAAALVLRPVNGDLA
ncbi:gluconate kinase [Streptacidiphilus pinicola]|uniref:Gluconokinase n=1 Tax=Streptacidiphilus pinicola TaxID=2219663 RepID=A0A2X0K687_9ACTN|nr:gluconokinase [Streptacidiphilus pinicola]RAG83079.1 gluconate kinase [Streptacidiphilus pinicola]